MKRLALLACLVLAGCAQRPAAAPRVYLLPAVGPVGAADQYVPSLKQTKP